MLSLKKLWSRQDIEEAYAAMRRVTTLILDGIVLHSTVTESGEHAAFRHSMRGLEESLMAEQTTPSEMLVIVGGIIQTLQEYNRRLERRIAAEKKDLQDMIAMLTGALVQVWRGNERAVNNLQGIERQLRQASKLEDLHVLKAKLQDCVAAVQGETERHIESQTATREVVRAAVDHPVIRAAMDTREEDPLTGLPSRAQAVAALEAALTSGKSVYAAPLVADRLTAIKQRFGAETTECYMLHLSQRIAQAHPEDSLFRWSGTAFLLLVEREGSQFSVQAELSRLVAIRTNCSVMVGSRAVMLPVSLASLCIPVWQSGAVEGVTSQIDSFVMKNAG